MDDSIIIVGGDVDKIRLRKEGKYPVLANALTNGGIVGYYDDDFRVTAPSVTVTARGDIGHAQPREENFTPVVRLLAIQSKHNVNFLATAINNHRTLIESTGVPQLTAPQLGKYVIHFTGIVEENKIGRLIASLDNLIAVNQRKALEKSPKRLNQSLKKLNGVLTVYLFKKINF